MFNDDRWFYDKLFHSYWAWVVALRNAQLGPVWLGAIPQLQTVTLSIYHAELKFNGIIILMSSKHQWLNAIAMSAGHVQKITAYFIKPIW